MATEREKMLAGELHNASDSELVALRMKALRLSLRRATPVKY
ncbi:MAG TPA: maltose acetyltransferase domain-containing protein [Methanocella sp.]|nr:maltose acetyltransferase domain-containing protein [Methanocella sp.]HTY91162.1 maltose acetyltransferase domain-containing protein [Methanocella sp.]